MRAPPTARARSAAGDRSERIRTYNFPQSRVTDHRINLTLYKLDEVLEGRGLDELIDALIADDEAAPAGGARGLTAAYATYDALLRDAAVALAAAGIDNVRFEARLLLAQRGRPVGRAVDRARRRACARRRGATRFAS